MRARTYARTARACSGGVHGFFYSHNGAWIGASDGIRVARAHIKEIEPIRRDNDIGRNRFA